MIDLLTMMERPPRVEWEDSDHSSRFLCIGLMIDWLDSRPEHATSDAKRLVQRANPWDEAAYAVAVITRRVEGQFWTNNGRGVFPADYRVYFHDQIAGYLHADEVAFGEHTYRRLHEVLPDCMSALVNLAELERRAGRETAALDLLHKALQQATSSDAARYEISDSEWEPEIRCALARLNREIGDGALLLKNARRDRLRQLVEQLESYDSSDESLIPAHQAFSVASAEQRIVLDAALRLSDAWHLPPPAAHGDFAAILAVEELVRQHEEKAPKEPKEIRYLFGSPEADSPSEPKWKSFARTVIATPILIVVYVVLLLIAVGEGLFDLFSFLFKAVFFGPTSQTQQKESRTQVDTDD